MSNKIVPQLDAAPFLSPGNALEAISAGVELHGGAFMVRRGRTYRVKRWFPIEETEELANFAALIVDEGRAMDGARLLYLEGVGPDGQRFPRITCLASRFTSMSWVLVKWGPSAVVTTGKGRLLAEAIQRLNVSIMTGDGR